MRSGIASLVLELDSILRLQSKIKFSNRLVIFSISKKNPPSVTPVHTKTGYVLLRKRISLYQKVAVWSIIISADTSLYE